MAKENGIFSSNSSEFKIDKKENEPQFSLKHIVTLSGEAGTGKSFIINGLAIKYGLNVDQIVQIGEMFRDLAYKTTGKKMEGFFERLPEVDHKVDALQISLLKDSRPRIIDSRLGGWLAQQVKQSQENLLPITSIVLFGQKDVLEKRVHRRDSKINPDLTLEELRLQTEERRKLDFEHWRKIHNTLPITYLHKLNQSPFVVDVTLMDKEAAISTVHELLLKNGALEKLPNKYFISQDR